MLARCLTFAIAISTLCGSSLAFAGGCRMDGTARECVMTFTRTEPLPTVNRHVSLDIRGVKPGMSLKAVKRIMATYYKSKPQTRYGTVELDYRDVMIDRAYVAYLIYKNDNETTWIYFGTPATDHTVVAIQWSIEFANRLPTVKQLYAALDKKYGPESTPTRQVNKVLSVGNDVLMNWVYGKNGKLQPCTMSQCPCRDSLNQRSFGYYAPTAGNEMLQEQGSASLSKDEYECVTAQVRASYGDPSHASRLIVGVRDPAEMIYSTKEAFEQMFPAAITAYNRKKSGKISML